MSNRDGSFHSLTTKRRRVLQLLGAAAGGLPISALPTYAREQPRTVTLGDFDSGLDRWKSNGGNRLRRVTKSKRPVAVTEGTHGLQVTVNGDPQPMIENKQRVKKADFLEHPYLIADVVPGPASETTSNITFKLRYHHTSAPAEGRGASSGKHGKPVLVEESDEITIPPSTPNQLYWDMSGISSDKRAKPKRLEIVWYPTEHPPSTGPRGRGPTFTYEGNVLFDSIRLTDSVDDISAARLSQSFLDLEFEHGVYRETSVESATETSEEGTFVFGDGTGVSYSLELVAEDRLRYIIDDETFRFGGGW